MLTAYLLVGAALFVMGLIGFVTRRNLIIMFLCTELMFQGIVVNLVALGRYPLPGRAVNLDGQVFSLFLLAIAAAEAAVALAVVVLLYRHKPTLDANAWRTLRDE
ncbi:MAG: NADH-quinone oxidoreductase subunit NuoK [Phycisphaerae bacterium]|jgi:NADH-quinone oxidoreductase subunit K